MRKIITTTFVTLDGVMQAPGGPQEDTSDGFTQGGWSANYWDEMMEKIMDGFMKLPFELLLGKRAYDNFAAFWPHTDQDQSVAVPFNATKKYVVCHQPEELPWQNSFLVTGDVPTEIKKLKINTFLTVSTAARAKEIIKKNPTASLRAAAARAGARPLPQPVLRSAIRQEFSFEAPRPSPFSVSQRTAAPGRKLSQPRVSRGLPQYEHLCTPREWTFSASRR